MKMYVGQSIGEFILRQKLGEGAFGEVWRVTNAKTGDQAAIKLFDSSNIRAQRNYEQEVEAYNVLSNRPGCDPYIVCMFHHGFYNNYYYIVQELMSGDLSNFSGEHGTPNYQIKDALSMLLLMYQCAEGLRHIHESGMVHSDIKPANILYSIPDETDVNSSYFNDPENMRYNVCIKYGDPGLACSVDKEIHKKHQVKKIDNGLVASEKCVVPGTKRTSVPSLTETAPCGIGGTPDYMAPEYYYAFHGVVGFPFTLQSFQANDVWGLGVVFRSIIDGWESILGLSRVTTSRQIVPVDFNTGPPALNAAINDIINNMMVVYNYKHRASATEIVIKINDVLEQVLSIETPPTVLSSTTSTFTTIQIQQGGYGRFEKQIDYRPDELLENALAPTLNIDWILQIIGKDPNNPSSGKELSLDRTLQENGIFPRDKIFVFIQLL